METIAKHKSKKGILVTARVHPGEPQSSFAAEGFMTFLLSNEDEAKQLRRNFVFYIVPMLNPDGVIQGNHRCSLLGVDLNRKWLHPSKILHPIIYSVKKLSKIHCEDREVPVFCDFHGHFRKRDAFMYCCSIPQDQIGYQYKVKNALLRIIPLLLSQRHELFSFADTAFVMEKFKESTARIVLFKECGILNSLTLECSFLTKVTKRQLKEEQSDPTDPKIEAQQVKGHTESEETKVKADETYHYTFKDHINLGEDLCRVLAKFIPTKPNQRRITFVIQKFLQILHSQLLASLSAKNDKANSSNQLDLNISGDCDNKVNQGDKIKRYPSSGQTSGFHKARIMSNKRVNCHSKLKFPLALKKCQTVSSVDDQVSADGENTETDSLQLNKEYSQIEQMMLEQAASLNLKAQQVQSSDNKESLCSSSEEEEDQVIKLMRKKKKKKVSAKEKTPSKNGSPGKIQKRFERNASKADQDNDKKSKNKLKQKHFMGQSKLISSKEYEFKQESVTKLTTKRRFRLQGQSKARDSNHTFNGAEPDRSPGLKIVDKLSPKGKLSIRNDASPDSKINEVPVNSYSDSQYNFFQASNSGGRSMTQTSNKVSEKKAQMILMASSNTSPFVLASDKRKQKAEMLRNGVTESMLMIQKISPKAQANQDLFNGPFHAKFRQRDLHVRNGCPESSKRENDATSKSQVSTQQHQRNDQSQHSSYSPGIKPRYRQESDNNYRIKNSIYGTQGTRNQTQFLNQKQHIVPVLKSKNVMLRPLQNSHFKQSDPSLLDESAFGDIKAREQAYRSQSIIQNVLNQDDPKTTRLKILNSSLEQETRTRRTEPMNLQNAKNSQLTKQDIVFHLAQSNAGKPKGAIGKSRAQLNQDFRILHSQGRVPFESSNSPEKSKPLTRLSLREQIVNPPSESKMTDLKQKRKIKEQYRELDRFVKSTKLNY